MKDASGIEINSLAEKVTQSFRLLQLAVPMIEAWEGKIPWLYRDTRGNVTVGMGRMLPNLQAALALPFNYIALGERATKTEIEADWNRVTAMAFGEKFEAGYYRSTTSVFLDRPTINAMAYDDVSRCYTELAHDFPTFEHMPLNVQLVMLDMSFNLGETKLRTKYPRFDHAADRGDYLTMALECERGGIPPKRNEWARHLILRSAEQTLLLNT